MPGAAITLAIADPHPVVRAGIRSFCEAQAGLLVVGECGSSHELLRVIATARPQCAIVDPRIAADSFEEVMAQMSATGAGTRVVVHGISHDAAFVRSILRAGACGYVLKNGPPAQVLEAVLQIMSGGIYLSPLIEIAAAAGAGETDDPRTVLSEREYQIFVELGQGARPRDIALSLGLSPKTVDTHRANILRKLKLDCMAALVKKAARMPRE